MKKILSFIFMLLAVLGLTTVTACNKDKGDNNPPVVNQDQIIVDEIANSFSLNKTEVSADFTLNTSAAGGVVISWASNNAAIVIEGQTAKVTRPAFADGDATVTLTATFTKGQATATKTYIVKVLKGEDPSLIEGLTVAEAFATELDTIIVVKGVVSALCYTSPTPTGFYLNDETGTIYVYGTDTAQQLSIGQFVVVEAKRSEKDGTPQLSFPTLKHKSAETTNEVSVAGAITGTTLREISSNLKGNYSGKTYLLENVYLDKYDGGSFKSYTIIDEDGFSLNLYSGNNGAEFADLDQYAGKVLTVAYCVNGQNNKGTAWRGHIIKVVSATDPVSADEPTEHVATTIAELVENKPESSYKVIYEVEGIWTVAADDTGFGNGTLTDASGNSITIYGLCATSEVVEWSVNKYEYDNDKSFASLNLADGTEVKLALVYGVKYDNYSAYFLGLTDNQKVKNDADAFTLSVSNAVENFTLPLTTGENGTTVAWSSNNAAIAIEGANATVTRPGYGEEDVTVTLTATFTLNGKTVTKDFTVTVAAVTGNPNADLIAADANLLVLENLTVTENFTLPLTVGENGTTVAWASDNAAIAIEGANATVTRPAAGENDATVVLTATLTLGEGEAQVTTTKTFTLTVSKKDVATIAEVLAAADNTAVVFQGVVTFIKADETWNTSYKNMSVTVSDGTNEIYVYRLGTQVALGDTIKVSGKVTTYNKNRQIDQGGTAVIISSNAPAAIESTIANVVGGKVSQTQKVTNIVGVVSEIVEPWSSYNNMSYMVTDLDGKSLYIYRSKTQVSLGQVLDLSGTVGYYYATGIQLTDATPTVITDLTDAEKAAYSKAALAIDTNIEDSIELPSTNPLEATITWASADANIISIAEGVATVTQTSAKQTVVLTATIVVGQVTLTKEFTITVNEKIEEVAGQVEVTLVVDTIATANSWANAAEISSFPTGDANFTITNHDYATSPKFYNSGRNWRIYKNSTLTFAAVSGYKLVSVTIYFDKGLTGVSNEVPVVCTSDKLDIAVTDTCKITKMVVVYAPVAE